MNSRLSKIKNWAARGEEAGFHAAELATNCGVSLRQLERYFVEQCWSTPTDWLRQLRCCRAVELILRGYSNKAVIEELGFGNVSHLCHDFKKVFGRSPQSFSGAHGVTRPTLAGVRNAP